MSSLRLVSERQSQLARVVPFAGGVRRDEAERAARALAFAQKPGQGVLQRPADRGPLHPGPAVPPPSAA